ncbi:MAG: SDR family oxidoreductase [Phycisphaerales bacterium]
MTVQPNTAPHSTKKPIFLTGATGYIGGRLAPRLLADGYRVRCLTRSKRKLLGRPWVNQARLEVCEANVGDHAELAEEMRGCGVAYYLVHSMIAAGSDYAEQDRRLALSFAMAAEQAGIERIIYLGGLGETGEDLSEHLRSRREVETALASTGIPVTVLRAAMIIGSGSASFEILRYLVERLPVMITPKWVRTECQPIAVQNVLEYLVRSITTPETVGRTLDIGGPDVLTYHEIMRIMAEERGLRSRVVLPVPVLTPKLSSLWIHLVTPLSSRIAQPLAEGLRNRVVCRNDEAARLMPQRLLSVRESIDAALNQTDERQVATKWSDAGVIPGDPDWAGGTTFVDRRQVKVDASIKETFAAVCELGGETGYHGGDMLWRLRGVMDRFVGGPGLRRGRRHPNEVSYGDAIDFWRVTDVDSNRRLELRAEMKLPGIATLTFDIESIDAATDRCRLVQTARFQPKGLVGLAYWYAVVPLHGIVFNSMLNGIRKSAEERSNTKTNDNRQHAAVA